MSRTKATTKRHAKILDQHLKAARTKPEVASISSGGSSDGFKQVVRGKATRVSGSIVPNIKFN